MKFNFVNFLSELVNLFTDWFSSNNKELAYCPVKNK